MKKIEFSNQINVGIVGYGSLGQALESRIYNRNDLNLVAIFSKRDNLISPFGTKFSKMEELNNYVDRIDYLFLCGGSFDEMESLSVTCAKNFNTIDCFDTHAKMSDYVSKLNKVCKENKKTSICACGWDPGIFSMMRTLMSSIDTGDVITFWGKGISQGHSNALRKINGVKDALSYTIPRVDALKKIYKGEIVDEKDRHTRVCYVVKEKKANGRALKEIIRLVPNYFEGYKVDVHFVSQSHLNKLKQKPYHKGQVFKNFIIKDERYSLTFSLDLPSNPTFTAECMLMGMNAVKSLCSFRKYGAFTLLDVPLKYLSSKTKKELVSKYL